MEYKDIKNLNPKELKEKVSETKNKLIDLKLKNSMGRLENPILIRKVRRQIAKLLTATSSIE